MAKAWYIAYTFSGYEQKIERQIRSSMKSNEDFATVCTDVKVPMQVVTELKNGVRKEVKKKILPGYILVEMDLPEDESYKKYIDVICKINGVSSFLTPDHNRKARPKPLATAEVRHLLQITGDIEGEPSGVHLNRNFAKGEFVKISSGACSGFNGTIEEVNMMKQRLKVVVEVFGRPTPIEVSFDSVEKL